MEQESKNENSSKREEEFGRFLVLIQFQLDHVRSNWVDPVDPVDLVDPVNPIDPVDPVDSVVLHFLAFASCVLYSPGTSRQLHHGVHGRNVRISSYSFSSFKLLRKIGGSVHASTDSRGNGANSKSTFSRLKVKASAQAPPKVNGSKVGVLDGFETDAAKTFINKLLDWSMLLAAITTLFLAAEKQWMMLDWKPKRPDMLVDPFGLGRIVQDGLVFRQNFSIRSYEIGADRTASVETLMNHFQETTLNHVKCVGLFGDGFGSTPEMCKKKLIWVITKMQVVVDRYPMWGDVVQVDTWLATSGKNGVRRDWLVRDSNTGEILTRASSQSVMINKKTRRLSRIPDEVRDEIGCHFVDSPPVVDDDSMKLPKLDDNTAYHIRTGLTSAPSQILETHELAGIALEYRKECMSDIVLQSLSYVVDNGAPGYVDFQHSLRLEGRDEIVKGRTRWRLKYPNGNLVVLVVGKVVINREEFDLVGTEGSLVMKFIYDRRPFKAHKLTWRSLLLLKGQGILYMQYGDVLLPFKYAGYPMLLNAITVDTYDNNFLSSDRAPLLVAASELVWLT
ncbi:hypothetical protein RD792_014680 [Penstemon davidsonii]|uniref:Acyl-[acyl-carrier-protein] hydrolase n=1 Tax=Penstemon davidsonii TaxID=160366 RepID=A0ABR0CQ52_9LAMI|nr:hypothetical protein RD792_014680 [Penstemon davidsonii]